MTAHAIARELLRQLAESKEVRAVALEDYGEEPRFYLDDDDPEDGAPHVVATPDTSEGGLGTDGLDAVRVTVSARDFEGDGVAPDADPGSGAGCFHLQAADRFDRLADAVWRAVRAATPGAILSGRSAEWAFAGFQPLRFAVFTLNYREIQSFGD